jgi:hypothetical protein
MHLMQPDPATALLGLRAMKMVADAPGAMAPSQRTLMEAARRVILNIEADIDRLAPITAEELAAGFPSADLRRQFVNGMLVMALAEGVPSREAVAKVAEFADALEIRTPEVTDLRRLAEHQMMLFKLDFLRRSQVGEIMRNQLDQHGVVGLAKSVLGLQGLMEDQQLAARYRAWEKLPEGTVGRALLEFYRRNGFSLPGERGGFPEAGLYHDLSHVLGSYDTSPEGEVEVASFSAGYKRHRPFYVVLFAVMIYSAGVNVRPTADGYTTVGVLGKPGMAERMFAAIERGSHVNTDLSDKWDYWPYVEMPLDEARRRLNIVSVSPVS